MSAPKDSQTELFDHFGFNSLPFGSGKADLQFFQLFSLDTTLPLTADQTIVYIQHVLNDAGSDHRLVIEEDAYQEIYHLSRGSIDQIKTIMNRAIQRAFENRTTVIGKSYIGDVFIDAPKGKTGRKALKANTAIPITIAAAVFICLIGAVLLFWKGNGQKAPETKPGPATAITQKNPEPGPAPLGSEEKKTEPASVITKKDNLPIQEPLPAEETRDQDQDTEVDEQVLDFLAAYNLEKYEPLFSTAIITEKFNTVTSTIYNETGLMLIHLSSIPDAVKTRYRILEKLILTPFHRRFFLFWKPSLVISKYKTGVKGEKIRQLQAMLRKLDLYEPRINGVVDAELTRALIRFQRRYFLEQTGSPDVSTLFLITELTD